MIAITFSNQPDNEGLKNLAKSCEKHGWELFCISGEWLGFGTKLITTYNFLKENSGIERFVFVDAHDVIMLGTPKEFDEKLKEPRKVLIGTEKACWPVADNASKFPETESDWKYINSGVYYCPSWLFCQMIEENPPNFSDDDQLWMQERFFENPENFVLDYGCNLIQSYSFIAEDDFAYTEGRLFNLKTGGRAVIIHANGRTPYEQIIKLIG